MSEGFVILGRGIARSARIVHDLKPEQMDKNSWILRWKNFSTRCKSTVVSIFNLEKMSQPSRSQVKQSSAASSAGSKSDYKRDATRTSNTHYVLLMYNPSHISRND